LKLKLSLLILVFAIQANALNVLVAKKDINFNEQITPQNLAYKNVDKVKKSCKPFTLKDLNSGQYKAKHFIRKGFIICTKSVKDYKKEVVVFDFGGIEIEKQGRLLNETDEYIIIKKPNGKTERIYKDGRRR